MRARPLPLLSPSQESHQEDHAYREKEHCKAIEDTRFLVGSDMNDGGLGKGAFPP